MSDAVLVPLILGGVLTLLGVVFLGIAADRLGMMRDWTRTTVSSESSPGRPLDADVGERPDLSPGGDEHGRADQ